MDIDNINNINVLKKLLKRNMVQIKEDADANDGTDFVFKKGHWYYIEQDQHYVTVYSDDYESSICFDYDEAEKYLVSKDNFKNDKENLETNPISYKFIVGVTIQSVEKDGEKYLKKLMHHFSNYDFKIVNGTYERKSISHDRLGNHNPYHWDIIEVKLNLERLVKGIHSPSDYINNRLHGEIYRIFDWFRTHVVPNDSKLDYVSWINEGWCEIDE